MCPGITNDEINFRDSKSPYWIEINNKADMYRNRLVDVLRQYSPLGRLWGKELLLLPSDALRLADNLQEIGIAILGFDCWYYYCGSLREDDAVNFYVGDSITWGRQPVHDSIGKVREFIQDHLPTSTEYVSLILYVPDAWNLFPSNA